MADNHFLPLYDASGKLHSVTLSAELWERGLRKLQPLVLSLIANMTEPEQEEPIEEWDEFLTYWDFAYPVCRDVTCEHCQAHTTDWQAPTPSKLFKLRSAQLGGLVVFTCLTCGATVRKKHFKDHYCFEATPKDKPAAS